MKIELSGVRMAVGVLVLVVLLSGGGFFGYEYWRETAEIVQSVEQPTLINPDDFKTPEQIKSDAEYEALQDKITYYTNLRLAGVYTEGADSLGKYSERNGVRDYSQNISKIKITWYDQPVVYSGEDAVSLMSKSIIDYPKILEDLAKNCCVSSECSYDKSISPCTQIIVTELGKMSVPASLADKVVYLLKFPAYYTSMDGEDGGKLAFFDESSKKLILLTDNIDSLQTQDQIRFVENFEFSIVSGNGSIASPEINNHRWFSGAINFSYGLSSYYNFPKTITIPEKNIQLIFVDKTGCGGPYGVTSCGLGGLNFNNEKIFDSFSHDQLIYQDEKLGSVYFTTSCFKLVMPNGSIADYHIVPPFFPNIRTLDRFVGHNLDIAWTLENIDPKYQLASVGGCGVLNCNNIVPSDSIHEDQLSLIGKAGNGDNIYELKDKTTNSSYRGIFESVANYWPDESGRLSATATPDEIDVNTEKLFRQFIADTPIIFWQDQLGNWRYYKKIKYEPAVECGKPVIYLYPTKDTEVNVKVEPTGGLTKVEPAYPQDGWTVKATPVGELTNLADGHKYSYLFWEGKTYEMISPDTGYVISRADVGDRMAKILAKMGLNKQEIFDFLEFWQPKMEVKQYVLVKFVSQRQFDKMAPLTVTPRPDQVIRVFMDYTPLDAPISVEEPRITTPVRFGFTVVEWGGRLR